MAILSECRDDTDDMLWDIYKKKKEEDEGNVTQDSEWLATLAKNDFLNQLTFVC